jgi:DNA-binding GntR family transcriptional regulator
MAHVRNLEMIRIRDLKPGAMVNEPGIVKQFFMSRGSIREAARHLEDLVCRLATLRMAKPEMQRFGEEMQKSWRIATAQQ